MDDKSFLFSLTKEKIFPSKKNCEAIFGSKTNGPWFAYIGFINRGRNNLTQGKFYYKSKDEERYDNYNDIIPNDKKDVDFNVKEVEVYKIFA